MLIAVSQLGSAGYSITNSNYNLTDCGFLWSLVLLLINGSKVIETWQERIRVKRKMSPQENLFLNDFFPIYNLNEFRAIRSASTSKFIPNGTVLFSEGSKMEQIYLITEGEIAVTVAGVTVNRRARGTYLGDLVSAGTQYFSFSPFLLFSLTRISPHMYFILHAHKSMHHTIQSFFTGQDEASATCCVCSKGGASVLTWPIEQMRKAAKQQGNSYKHTACQKFPSLFVGQIAEHAKTMQLKSVRARRQSIAMAHKLQRQNEVLHKVSDILSRNKVAPAQRLASKLARGVSTKRAIIRGFSFKNPSGHGLGQGLRTLRRRSSSGRRVSGGGSSRVSARGRQGSGEVGDRDRLRRLSFVARTVRMANALQRRVSGSSSSSLLVSSHGNDETEIDTHVGEAEQQYSDYEIDEMIRKECLDVATDSIIIDAIGKEVAQGSPIAPGIYETAPTPTSVSTPTKRNAVVPAPEPVPVPVPVPVLTTQQNSEEMFCINCDASNPMEGNATRMVCVEYESNTQPTATTIEEQQHQEEEEREETKEEECGEGRHTMI
jgi:hypothetical protein